MPVSLVRRCCRIETNAVDRRPNRGAQALEISAARLVGQASDRAGRTSRQNESAVPPLATPSVPSQGGQDRRASVAPLVLAARGIYAGVMSRFSKILVPIDFTPHSAEAVRCAVDLAGRYDAEVVLAYVYEPADYPLPEGYVVYTSEQFARMTEEIQKRIEAARRDAEAAGARRVATRLLQGSPAQAILELAGEVCEAPQAGEVLDDGRGRAGGAGPRGRGALRPDRDGDARAHGCGALGHGLRGREGRARGADGGAHGEAAGLSGCVCGPAGRRSATSGPATPLPVGSV